MSAVLKDHTLPRAPADDAAMEALFSSIDEAYCLCEIVLDEKGRPVDYRFLEVSDRFEDATGLVGATGRTIREMVPEHENFWFETYGKVALDRVPIRFENKAIAMGRWFDVLATPVEPHGRFAVLFRDITTHKQAEQDRAEALDRAEKLLEELNHRVMNSLSMIASIISLEARAHQDGQGREALVRIGDRVQAVAQLYRTLNAAGSVDRVEAGPYLKGVVEALATAISAAGVRIETRIDDMTLSTRVAAPLGLVVNELVTNSIKYAFADGAAGHVIVALVRNGDECCLSVEDDGHGYDGATGSDGLGQRLVGAFASQLDGEVEAESTDKGTRVSVRFRADA